jgi:peptidylprolyl isomerase
VRRLLVAVSLLALAVTACGSDTGGSGSSPRAASSTSAAATRTCGADDVKVSGPAGQQPTVTLPDGCTPPTTLVSKDLTPGNGAPLHVGQTALVHYDLYTWSDHQELDTSWRGGQPFTVSPVGHAAVIDGWNEGLPGMKKGGRRLLIIPPDKGYGPGGNGVKPNETLVFVVDLLQITG